MIDWYERCRLQCTVLDWLSWYCYEVRRQSHA
jgi:hypothetical protein